MLYTHVMTEHGHRLGREVVYGPHEVAAVAGVLPSTVAIWRQRYRGEMPEPDATISGVPIWRHGTIISWLRSTGRVQEGEGDA